MAQFNRHRKNSKINPEYKDTPWKDNGYIAWLIWGGDAGVDWALAKMDEIRKNESQYKLKGLDEWLVENEIDESKIADITRKLYRKGTDFTKSVIQGAKREGRETKEVVKILRKMIKGQEISDDEKKFLKAQSTDIVKLLPVVAISTIPIPVPITPLLVILGKKYGINILPNSHDKIELKDLKANK